MELLLTQILKAYQSVTKVKNTYRIQDLVIWINANGGINGREVTRAQVMRGIVKLLEGTK